MLNHQAHDEINEFAHPTAAITEEPDQVFQSTDDAIEDYLDRVCAPLVGTIARSKREEIRQRVRLRLEQFTTAHRELGSTDAEAVELALTQCGDPELISRRWLPDQHSALLSSAATGRTHHHNVSGRLSDSSRAATRAATLAFGLPYIAFLTQVSGHMQSTTPENAFDYNRIWLLAVPFIAGILTGLAAKDKPVRGVLNANGILAGSSIVVAGLVGTMLLTGIGPDLSQFAGSTLASVVCGIVPWIVLGCTGAAIGQRFRKVGSKLATRAGRIIRTRKPAR